ncbi:MAG: hypothetical protein HYY96_03860 [Candidatus Tectomicrobia bacterium]|nr:hypothetical protein [Candidatus Tectomicrobia bacterium]
MAYIRVIDEHEASGELDLVYQKYRDQYGVVPEIRKVLSLKPGFVTLYDAWVHSITFGGSRLGRYREELIAVLGSSLNKSSH